MKFLKLKSFLVGFTILVLLTSLRISDPFFIETARLKGLDYYQRTQEKVMSENISVVEIDEQTLEQNGQWPWSRDVLAKGVEKAFENGASVVVLPILFSEPDRFGKDEIFIEALKKYPVITGQSAAIKGKGVPIPRGLATIGSSAQPWLFEYPSAIGPMPEIGAASAGTGMIITAPEVDNIVRRMPLAVQINNEVYPSFPLEVLRVISGEPSYQAKVTEAGITAIRVKGSPAISTDANARVWINFKYKFPSVSYSDKDWSSLNGKIVFISLTAEGLSNTVATPINITYGHELTAQALQMLINQDRLERPSEFDLYEIIATVLILLSIIFAVIYLPYFVIIIYFLVAISTPYLLGSHLFLKYNLLADYTFATFAIFVTWAGTLFMRFIIEFKLKQQIKKQFGTYLSPDMVEKLQKNPDLLKLGGDSRELSIMFTDVRGFTTISEHYGNDVQGLTKIMNRYMTAMTQAILDNNGTLDKYIGDAQMAFWNAPLDNDDHARDAVKTAMQMLSSLDTFNEEIAKEGVPAFGMGLGINTGTVVVGNMGSTQRFDYTCLGDSVNLASRLEGQSKPYGVKIIIGPLTYQKIQMSYCCFELDCIAVKGKKEGVRIYTVLQYPNKISYLPVLAFHNTFLSDYRNQRWDTAITNAKWLMDQNKELKKYYEAMIERIEELKKSPPEANWDGVFRATSK